MRREWSTRRVARRERRWLSVPAVVLVLAACSESRPPRFQEVDWRFLREVGRELFRRPGSPVLGFNALAAGDGRVYLYDSQGTFPFYAIDAESFEVRGFGAWGRGPGEIARGFPAVLSVTDGRIFAHALLESKLLVFSEDLALLDAYGPVHGLPTPGTFYAVSDTLGVFFSSDPSTEPVSLARAYRIGAADGISRMALTFGDYAERSELKPLRRNPMLALGPVHADRGGRIFWAHYYSSLRTGFAPDGAPLFLRFDPRGVRIPDAKMRQVRGVAAGDPERAVQSYLALASDDDHLYALYSGVELTREAVMAKRAERGGADLRLGEARIVDVFDKADGSYRLSLTLPIWVTNLAVDRRRLYAITLEGAPRLLVYEKPRIPVDGVGAAP